MSSASIAGTRAVEFREVRMVMGTFASVAAWAPDDHPEAVHVGVIRALAWLHEVEDRFTTWRPSEWLRFATGEFPLDESHPDLRHVVDRCHWLTDVTDGAFSLHARPDRPADPAAFVKGWAAQRAADLLVEGGTLAVNVNCGGDVVVWGGDRPWRIGIQDPFDRDRIRGVIELTEGAVATSGAYERGGHIFDPTDGQPAASLASVTVVGPDLGVADAFSTAAFAQGISATRWLDRQPEYSYYLIGLDGSTTSRGMGLH